MLESVIKNLIGKAKLGSFCTSIKSDVEDFGLIVEGAGKVKIPIMPKGAKSLISVAKPASFGKKDKTVYDSTVRDVWEIPANNVTISNHNWEQKLSEILKTVHNDLNMPKGSRLIPHLHNLLIYERGQFFAPHQDSEKYDGMVATLVVLLPSNFSGGTLRIDQHGDKKTFEAKFDSRNHLNFIAFYADCHHEVTKVTAGYRIALTYNLVLEGAPKQLPRSLNSALTQNIKNYFTAKIPDALSYRGEDPRWLVYLFDHQYTQKSLQWSALKGADRESAAQFLAAAKDLDLVPHLALADIHESWTAEADFDDYYDSYPYRRRHRGAKGDGKKDRDPESVEVQDLILYEVTLSHWLDHEGLLFDVEPKSVRDEMVCWSKANDEFKPLDSQYEGYMGNYGNTVDRWYHRAAIVLWPKDTDIVSQFEVAPAAVLEVISQKLVDDLPSGQKDLEKVLTRFKNRYIGSIGDSSIFFDIAFRADDKKLAEEVLQNIELKIIQPKLIPILLPLLSKYGEDWFVEQLISWSKKSRQYRQRIDQLQALVTALSSQYRKITSWLISHQRERIFELDQEREKCGRKYILESEPTHLDEVADLLRASSTYIEESNAIVDHISNHPDLYSPTGTAKLIFALAESPLPDLLKTKLTDLTKVRLNKIVSTVRADGDWSVQATISCRCKDCVVLKDFLNSSTLETYVWPLGKERRQHIHRMIDQTGLAIAHETLRQGSPQKLILKKTNALFKTELKNKSEAAKALLDFEKVHLSPAT